MTEKLIHIEKRFDNVSKNNKPYLKLVDGSSSYSCWETRLFPKLTLGSTVNCRIEENGNFTNILEVLDDDGTVKPQRVWTPDLVMKLFAKLDAIEKKVEAMELVEVPADTKHIPLEEIPL